MGKRLVYRLSFEQQAQLWALWREGRTLRAIGKVLGVPSGTVHRMVAATGGMAPPARRRAARALTLAEREEISRGLAREASLREIAAGLDRPVCTVSREVARHGGRGHYRASDADTQAWANARRPKACRLAEQPELARLVAAKLDLRWSPQQIAGWLKLRFPDDQGLWVSHETIYRSLFVQARGVLKKELQQQLRSPRSIRKPRATVEQPTTRGQIVDAIPIAQRPAQVQDRAVPGHWEGDLLSGARNSHIATLVERQSRYVDLVKVKGKDTRSVVSALTRRVRKLPANLWRTLTWDRGTELAEHKRFTVATDVKVYFCDPRSPWQRGTNENTNGLLRQYFPDGTDLSTYSQAALDRVALELNQRPRQTLGFQTPAEVLAKTVALTV